ncbi:helix-turn-helix domain-containing protein [Corynebacterium cystitidis]|uniref:Transcriptional regulator, contains XRE-family HTH domain n=1 Tax=Corynebacterium cystitidis DSM 20524 TaxID=1121357 RepID=A0A1H9P5P3_9CORY|nr:helix-turn-helix domain-containing protein [Corynebacterium cystitidis]WJY82619.1 Transcriptional regulator ClgR [Corynebacterium cystitidis DSM 20524]SER43205.1 Transcriptional regulator, contains XRE-family HTH domain [Corynebacterium cystitidis DSM 20524]SNV72685.1 transcription regulator [Corynebacterium cystitidis]
MATTTALLDNVTAPATVGAVSTSTRQPEPLLREALGLSLRAFRADKGITLRDLAQRSRVSPGYLSELERGQKEVSSELLASVCHALDTTVAEVLVEAASNMTLQSMADELAQTSPAAAEA